MRVLVDTTAFYALVDADDDAHEGAVEAWRGLAEERAYLVTHDRVMVESIALVQARIGIDGVRDLLPFLEGCEVIWTGPDEHEVALAAFLASGRRRVSLVDQLSFHLMRRNGIDRALAFDHHFTDEGFELA